MESGDLKIFQAVAREGSITRAAQKLNYVQSNVTNRIQQLEMQLKTRLFNRTNRGMKLTPAGQNLLHYADQITNLLDEAIRSTEYTEQPKGPLRIGSLETAAAIHLPRLMRKYHRCFPEVDLSLITGASHDLLAQVVRSELDGAFIYGPVEHSELEQLPAFSEELVLISEPGETHLNELLKKPLLFFGTGCSHLSRVERLLGNHEMTDYRIMEFGTLEAILGGVSAGLGVSLLPRSSVARMERYGDIHVHSLPEELQQLDVVFVYRRDILPTSAFEQFVSLVREQQAESNR